MKQVCFSTSKFLIVLILLATGLIISCGSGNQQVLNQGVWRGVLQVQGRELPFNFEVTQSESMSYQIHLVNGEEQITTNDVRIVGDSLFATMHIFDTEIKVRLSKKRMRGVWVKNYEENYSLPFKASYGDSYRFESGNDAAVDISGKWRVNFSADSMPGVGIFQQQQEKVVGTFLTGSGDYRYLDGSVIGDSIFLSAFDGEHAFLFNAKVNPNEKTMKGEFRSGSHFFDTWRAEQNPTTELVNPDSITYLKPGYDRITFSFPDLNGRTVSLSDSTFQDKIVILQLFGSWCPNCMDETKFLADWYNQNRELPVEIIGLAYERLDDFTYAKTRLNKLATKFNVNYEILVAGTSDKEEAGKTLPMLSHINAFPTTIFLDHLGKVRKIHTGFMGPGSGEYYYDLMEDFENFVNQLIMEKHADTVKIQAYDNTSDSLVP
jgi:thiol-disulfide isomerase/thioredoxin